MRYLFARYFALSVILFVLKRCAFGYYIFIFVKYRKMNLQIRWFHSPAGAVEP